jgi:hypothetical protein
LTIVSLVHQPLSTSVSSTLPLASRHTPRVRESTIDEQREASEYGRIATRVSCRKVIVAPRLIEKVILPNGLVLELWDQSRPLPGHQWRVSLLARMEIPLVPDYFTGMEHGQQLYQDLVAAYGDRLSFTREKARHFVPATETERVLTELCQRFKDNVIPYLSNPRFASLYALKKCGDLYNRQHWGDTNPDTWYRPPL